MIKKKIPVYIFFYYKEEIQYHSCTHLKLQRYLNCGMGFTFQLVRVNNHMNTLGSNVVQREAGVKTKWKSGAFQCVQGRWKLYHNNSIVSKRQILFLFDLCNAFYFLNGFLAILFVHTNRHCLHIPVHTGIYVPELLRSQVHASVVSSTSQSNCTKIQKSTHGNISLLKIFHLYLKRRLYQIPKQWSFCQINSFNMEDANSVITVYLQSDPGDIRATVINELLDVRAH